ncbi:unnamed protein product [Leptosia nina]|uniref:Uncharacterized protein n=1 Tax=Leptosia nina TaxID=320188 RepID=A0AAV1JSP6_9NEOP
MYTTCTFIIFFIQDTLDLSYLEKQLEVAKLIARDRIVLILSKPHDMARKKFSGESPYKVAKETCPDSHWLFTDFSNKVNLVSDKPCVKPPVIAAIFGLGRAGSIHLCSINRNPRVLLKYIVDDRKERLEKLRAFWKLELTNGVFAFAA